MKRFLTILLAALALTAALCVSASASNFDEAAQDLSAIGMFRGTGSGFALDQAPTRGQAAIMLVRLYGAETQAQNTYRSGRITNPFTDVNETVAPYVAWLADEGIANGTSATTFGASQPCTARAYTIFLLRALGYEDDRDFTTVTAQDFAASLGLIDTSVFTGKFLRDDLAALTYQALGTDLKDGSTYLLDSLIKEGVIKESDAYPIVKKIETLRALNKASEGSEKGLSAGLDMNLAVTVTAAGNNAGEDINQVQQTAVTGKGDIQVILGKRPQMAFDMEMTVDGEKTPVQMWMRDGWVYVKSGEEAVKSELPEEYQELMTSTKGNSNMGILPFLGDASSKTNGGETVHTLELNDAFSSLLNGVIAQALKESGLPEGVDGEMDMNGFTLHYTVKDGVLKSADADAALTMALNMDMGEGAKLKMTVGVILEMTMEMKATGDQVKISFPDLSGFKEAEVPAAEGDTEDSALKIIGGADGPTAVIVSAIV